jgi:tight adherence protein C
MSGVVQDLVTADLTPAVLGALALCVVTPSLGARVRRRAVSRRLTAFVQNDEPLGPPRAQDRSFFVHALAYLGGLVARRLPARLVSVLQRQALRAGQPGAAVDTLLGLRVAALVAGGLLAVAFASADQHSLLAQLGALLVVAIAALAIDLLLISRAGSRARAAVRDLPMVLDLLSLTMGAGMAFDLALSTILDHVAGPLADELRRYLADVNDLGVARAEALESVAMRLSDPPDVVAFVDAINRAHVLGTGLLAAVGSQATLLRQEQRRRAAASAQRAPVRMIIPMALFMLPVLMLVVLAPVALRLMNAIH